MKKKAILIIIAVVLVAALAAVYFLTKPAGTEGSKSFTVEIIHKDGSEKKLTLRSDAEFLNEVLEAEGLVEYFEGQGCYIKSVDGEEAIYEDGGYYWSFSVNGQLAMVGVDETPLVDGDVYTLKNTNESMF